MMYLQQLIERIQENRLKSVYSHDNATVLNGAEKVMKFDCSGLVEMWLRERYPLALKEVFDYILQVRDTEKYDISRLYSFDFYDFFKNIKNDSREWQRCNIEDCLQKGDILAFINPLKKWRWGHMAVVKEELARNEQKITVKVIDSSANKHIEDMRQHTGIGQGIIELYFTNNKVEKVCYDGENMRIRYVCIGRLKKIKI